VEADVMMEDTHNPEKTLAGMEDGEVTTIQQTAEAEQTRLHDAAEDEDEEEAAEETEISAANKDQEETHTWIAPPNSSTANYFLKEKIKLN
jgi:hypothetical protein